MIDKETTDLLDKAAREINSPAFISDDPVQFPRRFSELRDIEIAAFLSAIIAWGKRTMICRDAERMLEMMDHQPFNFLRDGAYEYLTPEKNLHRTFFARHLQYFMRGLGRVYSRFPSLDAFAAHHQAGKSEAPSWAFVEALQKEMCEANGGATCSECLPVNLQQTALKRINMALRWLVRDDGIVDIGVWKSIPKEKLFIPLDVHVGNVSRQLGLLRRRSNDRKAVLELTDVCRQLNPADPAIYDFALFGIGITSKTASSGGMDSRKKTDKIHK